MKFMTMYTENIHIATDASMKELGMSLSKKYKVLFLEGQLGAGKTTLIKGFAEWLGINPKIVNSPSYTYVQIYNNHLLHIDMYNVHSYEELLHKWILDLIHHHEYIAIEWPKFISSLGIRQWLYIQINPNKDTTREVQITEHL